MQTGWRIDNSPVHEGAPFGQRLKVIVVNELTCEIVDEWGIRRLVNRAMMETMTPEEE